MSTWEKGNKLTAELLKKIEELCDKGLYDKHVQPLVGIPNRTWYWWKSEATKLERKINAGEIKEDDLPEDDKKILQFLRIVKKGRAKAVEVNIDNIQTAGMSPDHWQASAWFLERTCPSEYGRRDRHELTGAGGGPVVIKVVYDEDGRSTPSKASS